MENLIMEPVTRLTKDLAVAAATLSVREARYLVDAYYTIQDYRIASDAQIREMTKSGEPHDVLKWAAKQYITLESQLKRSLDKWTDNQYMGRWAKAICGIGPVISAGLLAHIDIEKAPTVGHIWRFAGLDPTNKWLGREKSKALVMSVCGSANVVTEEQITQIATLAFYRTEQLHTMVGEGSVTRKKLVTALTKRPYNADLKTLCAFKLGESFVMVQNNKNDIYGKVFAARKREEEAKNDVLAFKAQAEQILVTKNFDKTTDAYKALIQGRLPQAQIHARARRYAVKLFLSHYHAEAYRQRFGKEPPLPYPIAFLGHAHMIDGPKITSITE